MNPRISVKPCFSCKEYTDETQSILGVGHLECYYAALRNRTNIISKPKPEFIIFFKENLNE